MAPAQRVEFNRDHPVPMPTLRRPSDNPSRVTSILAAITGSRGATNTPIPSRMWVVLAAAKARLVMHSAHAGP